MTASGSPNSLNVSGTARIEIASIENAEIDGEIAHSGDTDTKISFDTDTIKFDTAGSERLRISANGDVRVGGGVPATFGSGTTVHETYNANTYVANLVTSGTHQLQMIASQTHGATSIGTRSNHDLNLCANDSTKVTVTTDGKVQVGSGVTIEGNGQATFTGIVTCHQLYVNGNEITSSGGGSDPVGTIVIWSGSAASIPSEYQLCDGSAASTSALQAITGANVPDLRDKFIVGASNSTGDTTYPGVSPNSTGGQKDAIVPNHTHPTTIDGGHVIPANANTTYSYGGAGTYSSTIFSMDNPSNGESVTNKNLPPYYALCYIIKHTATSGSGGASDKIEEGNTKAEVIDTGSNGQFVVTTEGVERVIVDPSGYLNTRADIRLRRTASDDGALYFGDTNDNYIFGSDTDDILTLATAGSERIRITSGGNVGIGTDDPFNMPLDVRGQLTTVASFTSNANGSQGANVSISHRSPTPADNDIVGTLSFGGLDSNDNGTTYAQIRTTATDISNNSETGWLSFYVRNGNNTTGTLIDDEKLRIKPTSNTYANCDDIVLNNGGGLATTNNVTGVINMGSSYYHDGTGNDLGNGSGHWNAVKLHLWKDNAGSTNAGTINNIYGLGVSHGMMEIQTDAVLGFFVGRDTSTTAVGSRTERMRIGTSGLLSIGSSGQLINESGLGARSAGNTCVLKAEGSINHNPLICWNNSTSGSRSQIAFGDGSTFTWHGTITTNGSNVNYGGQSDYRLKQDEILITDGIEKVKLLKPRRFKWKDNLDLGICDGFFAHEIEEAIPTSQAIVGTKDAVATESDINVGFAKSIGEPIYQQVDQSKLIPILTAALKEAIAKIETLETKVATLEGS